VFMTYVRIMTVTGSIVGATHGHLEREKRQGPLVESRYPEAVVVTLRDGLLGAALGPFVAPFVFPIATWQMAQWWGFRCPFSQPAKN
jgi:hypothetical protein